MFDEVHSKDFWKIKNFWDQGLLGAPDDDSKYRQYVVKGKITPEEFTEITGREY